MEDELPPPEVWHGLSDYEYNQVYENSSANPHRRLSKKQQKRLQKDLKQQAENGLQNGITIPDTLKEQFDMNNTKEQTNADAAVNEVDQLINDESNAQPTSTTNVTLGPENAPKKKVIKKGLNVDISNLSYNAIKGAIAFLETKGEKLSMAGLIERAVRVYVQRADPRIPDKFNAFSEEQRRTRIVNNASQIIDKAQNYSTSYEELVELDQLVGPKD